MEPFADAHFFKFRSQKQGPDVAPDEVNDGKTDHLPAHFADPTFPAFRQKISQSLSVTKPGSDRVFSFTKFRMAWICGMSVVLAVRILIFKN